MELQTTILSALIAKSPAEKQDADSALKEALSLNLSSEHFSGVHKFLFETVAKQSIRSAILDREILETYIAQSYLLDEDKSQVRLLFSACREATTEIDKLKVLVPAYIEQQNTQLFGNVLSDSVRILTEGMQVGRDSLKGLEDSRRFLTSRIASLQKFDSGNSPQGYISGGMTKFWDRYEEAVRNPNIGLLCGIKEIDKGTKGCRPGELFTMASYSKQGKSQFLRVYAYHSAIKQRKNVVFATIEMNYDQILDNFVSLHTTNPKFGDIKGIPVHKITDGSLNEYEKNRLKIITQDLTESSEYGALYILQLPAGSTISSLHEKLMYLNTLFPVQGLFLDYATLLKSESPKFSTVQEHTEIYQNLHSLAKDFNEGKGLPVVNAHQISRKAFEDALKSEERRYSFGFTSDSVESERSADCLLWLLRDDAMVQSRECKIGMSLFRRGPLIPDFRVLERYEVSSLSSFAPSTIPESVLTL